MAQAVDWVGRINAFAREKEKGKRKRLGSNRFTASRAPVPVVSPGASRRHRATERERERETSGPNLERRRTSPKQSAQTPHHKPSRQLVKTRSEPAPKRLDTEPEGGEWGRVEGVGGGGGNRCCILLSRLSLSADKLTTRRFGTQSVPWGRSTVATVTHGKACKAFSRRKLSPITHGFHSGDACLARLHADAPTRHAKVGAGVNAVR